MVAPNGARRTKADHPNLPMSEAEIVDAVAAAHAAGAQGAHVHVRDESGTHVLDAARYIALTAALRARCGPDLIIQVTTEAVGRYTPEEQRALVDTVRPQAVSIALQELFADPDESAINRAFLERTIASGTAVQWILYAPNQIEQLVRFIDEGIVPPEGTMLFVLGRYAESQESDPTDLLPFLATQAGQPTLREWSWSVCAFGRGETACLSTALALGGDVRIGFENSLWHADGHVAQDNAERVSAICALADQLGLSPASPSDVAARLGFRSGRWHP
ncbi:MAG: 3-keto-5-aminohexanoate cleavage protein [Pseudomonadota bacterium]